ncbi:hypothetical protein ANTPLA_LOCUS6609 [Anthophora plagiata]
MMPLLLLLLLPMGTPASGKPTGSSYQRAIFLFWTSKTSRCAKGETGVTRAIKSTENECSAALYAKIRVYYDPDLASSAVASVELD